MSIKYILPSMTLVRCFNPSHSLIRARMYSIEAVGPKTGDNPANPTDTIDEMKNIIKKIQEDIALLQSQATTKNQREIKFSGNEALDTKKMADITKVLSIVGAFVGSAYWLSSELHSKPSREELKGEISSLRDELKGDIAALRTEMKSELRDTEKRIIDTVSKDIRLALIEAENNTLKIQQKKS